MYQKYDIGDIGSFCPNTSGRSELKLNLESALISTGNQTPTYSNQSTQDYIYDWTNKTKYFTNLQRMFEI